MVNSMFNPDNLFWRIISRAVDFVGLGILWALLCIPVVTIGPATAALYYTVVKTFRQGEDRTFRIMLTAFRDNLKIGIPATLICAPVFLFIAWGYRIMASHTDTGMGIILFMAYYVVLVVPVGTMLYLFPIMGRFQLKLKELFRTSFELAVRHLPSTIIIVLLNVQLIVFTLEKWSPIFITPVGGALLTSLFLEKIFPKYLSKEENAVLQNKTVEELEAEEQKKKKKKEKK